MKTDKTKIGKDLLEKLLGLGKDRYVLLLCIGLLCVLISSTLEGTQKKQKLTGEQTEEQTEEEVATGSDLDYLFGQRNRSGDSGQATESSVSASTMGLYGTYYQTQIENLLSNMEGVGQVSVLLTMKSSEELVLERNNPYNRRTEEVTKDNEQSMTTEIESDSQVIFYENAQGRDSPVVVKRYAPKVEAVVVLAQGADDPSVAAKISSLLMALFDLPEHKIKVAKYRT